MAPKIRSVKDDPPAPLSMLLYGPHKAGKTTMIATMPNPVFIVPQGRGTGSLKTVLEKRKSADADIHYIPVNSRKEMEEACIYVRNNAKEHGWQTCGIDPLTIYGRMCQMELTNAGYDGWDVWRVLQQDILNNWNTLMSGDLHVVFSLHVDAVTSGDVIVNYTPKLLGKSLGEVAASVDMIAFLEKVDVAVRDEQGAVTGKVETQRRLWTKCPSNKMPPFEAGCRWEEQLSEGCYVPDWAVLAKRLKGHVRT